MNDKAKKKGEEGREYIRVKYNVPVIVETADMALSGLDGYIQDISAQGVMFEVSEKLYPGLLVRLQLKMKSDLAPLVGNVQWVRVSEDKYLVGVKLDDTVAEQNDRVIEMVTDEIINESRKEKK